jgi:hypothetical protein
MQMFLICLHLAQSTEEPATLPHHAWFAASHWIVPSREAMFFRSLHAKEGT